MNNSKPVGNMLLVANWESDVGYAWWLMEGFWINIAQHLEARGIECILIYPEITKIPETVSNSNITVVKHAFRDKKLSNLRNLYNLIKKYNIRHIYLTDSPLYDLVYLILRLWGIKTITIHEHTPGERTPPRGIIKLIKSTIQHLPFITADRYIAVTDYIYDRFINVSCIPSSKCFSAPNGIIPIEIEGTDEYYANNLFNIPKNNIIVVTTGRATYYKRIDFFIKCANELINNRNMKNFHFLFCGDGPDLDDFKEMIEKFNLKENFTFAGKRNDIRQILPSCHIGLHSSSGEVGYSLSILEYMSANLLTVVPNNSSVSLATNHNETGLLYEEGNIFDCADKISSFTTNKDIASIRKKGRESVLSNFNLAITHSRLLDNFNDDYIKS